MTSTQLRFTAAANESFDKREGKIVIRSGELSETVTVYQAGEQPGVMLTQDEYTVGSEGGIVAVELFAAMCLSRCVCSTMSLG